MLTCLIPVTCRRCGRCGTGRSPGDGKTPYCSWKLAQDVAPKSIDVRNIEILRYIHIHIHMHICIAGVVFIWRRRSFYLESLILSWSFAVVCGDCRIYDDTYWLLANASHAHAHAHAHTHIRVLSLSNGYITTYLPLLHRPGLLSKYMLTYVVQLRWCILIIRLWLILAVRLWLILIIRCAITMMHPDYSTRRSVCWIK